MNKKYEEDAEYDYGEVQVQVDPDGIPNNGDEYMDWENTETLISPAYSVTHPTGARISVMVGFNLSK